MSGMEQAPTRSAVLELKGERVVVGEAYDFLGGRRLLLAAELLRQLDAYDRLQREFETLRQQAVHALVQAVARHGLQGLEVYPADNIEAGQFNCETSNFMGVTLARAGMRLPDADTGKMPANPSAAVRACQAAFRELLLRAAQLAGVSGNLHRLLAEYRLTERRARALENVILPEIEQSLKVMTTHLEELEFEDTMRVRRQAGI